VRALESEAPRPLFNDPYARELAGPYGFEVLKAAQDSSGTPPRNPYVVIRTRFIDDQIGNAVAGAGIRQVVLLAAGLDARAFRFDWPADLWWFEVDRDEIFRHKEPVLSRTGARASCRRTVVSADLEHEWVSLLAAASFVASRPTLFVVEGLLVYLERPAVEALLSTISGIASPGSRLITDVVNEDMLTSVYTRPMVERLREMNCSWRFGTSQPEAFFEAFGWRVTLNTPGEPHVGHGRWEYPTLPESVPGIPRTYFVTGRR
jgi:methyltransferase (TIGR00027 family)